MGAPSKIRNLSFIHTEGDVQLRSLSRTGRELARKIFNRSAKIGVIGLGYRGLSSAVELAMEGFHVTGIDADHHRVESVNAGISYDADVPDDQLFSLVSTDNLKATKSLDAVHSLDVLILCAQNYAVPDGLPHGLRAGQLVCLDFPARPGMTRALVGSILSRSRLRVGQEIFLIYTRNGDDAADPSRTSRNTPRIIGGVTPSCTALGRLFYGQDSDHTLALSSAECAEMVGLFEQGFFEVNSALVMEMALLCRRFALDVREVIEAAKTMGFGFMAFDPATNAQYHRLLMESWASGGNPETEGVGSQIINAARSINGQMPGFIVARVADALNDVQHSVKGANILVLGVVPKRNTTELRGSLTHQVLESLLAKGAVVHYADPHVPSLVLRGASLRSQPLSAEFLRMMDCGLVLANHPDFDFKTIATHCPMILDCCNAFKGIATGRIIPL